MRRHSAVIATLVALAGCRASCSTSPEPLAPPAYQSQRLASGAYAPPVLPPVPIPPPPPPPPAALAPPPPPFAVAPPPPQAVPPGWTTFGGMAVPVIPGITAPGAMPFAVPGMAPPPPAMAAFSGHRCGTADIGGRRVTLDCMTPDYGEIPGAQFALVPRRSIDTRRGFVGGAALPVAVDNRASGLEGPIRDQGATGACTAFSLAAAIDHAVGRASRRPTAVSVQHAWAKYHTPTMQSAASANRGSALAPDAAWPYDAREACSWTTPCEEGECGSAQTCGHAPDARRLQDANGRGVARVTEVTRLDVRDMEVLRDVVAKGQDVWFAMFVGDSFMRLRGRDAIVPDADFRGAPSGHAMVIAGYRTQANGLYFLLHNSWGTDWGDGGYAWIHEATLLRNIRSAYVVEAEPVGAAANPAVAPVAPPVVHDPPGGKPACASGLPDSVTNECVPPCADGSPRARGACPSPAGCPPGDINLFGFCVVSAPTKAPSVDPASGVQSMCGAGGCNYVIPGGRHGCQQFFCTHSCAAPKYLLTVGANGLSCSE